MRSRLLKWGGIGIAIVVRGALGAARRLDASARLLPPLSRAGPAHGPLGHLDALEDLVRAVPHRTRREGVLGVRRRVGSGLLLAAAPGAGQHEPTEGARAGRHARSATRATGAWRPAATCSSRIAPTSRRSSWSASPATRTSCTRSTAGASTGRRWKGCLAQCHNGDKASNACLDCHTRKKTPASHSKKDWLVVHGQGGPVRELRRLSRLDA